MLFYSGQKMISRLRFFPCRLSLYDAIQMTIDKLTKTLHSTQEIWISALSAY